MSWIQENKFVAGLAAVTLVGAGALGYLLTSAKAAYEENHNLFTEKVTELNRLQTLPAFPNKDNFDVLEAQRKAHQDLIEDLQKQLSSAQLPLEPVSPFAFQDILKESVTKFTTSAAGKMELPKDFYFGFNVYASTPPSQEAAPLLARQLKAIELIFQDLLKNEVAAVTKFDRPALPEEAPGGRPVDPNAKPPSGAQAKEAVTPVEKQFVDLEISGDQRVIRSFLNGLATSKKQLFIARYVAVENSVKVGPPKVDPNAPATPAPGAEPAPAANPGAKEAPKSPIIVGDEQVIATLRVETVNVPPPAPPVAATGRGSR